MNKKTLLIVVVAILLTGAITYALTQTTTPEVEQNTNQVDASDYISAHQEISTLPLENLTADEKEGLVIMREEEKLARDVYLTLYNKWGLSIFRNIASSEQTHTDSIRYLIERYNLTDPVTDETIGVFTNQTFQDLYTALVKQGEQSLIEALKVGATIEDLDIKDLQEFIEGTDNQDIITIYENLLRGSRNHMRSFDKQLTQNGGTYTAQYLEQAEIDKILAGSQERGDGNGDGNSQSGRNR